MYVFLLERGENGEGGSVLGVYADRQCAISAANAEMNNSWYKREWEQYGDELFWQADCDWICISKRRVHNV